ncbi:glycosyltransferase family 4 protein [Subsaxibacter sp. CAU 1640]|uniref:glycosyltransferase family 4 protein n=1 Tax=Subsaxibacter sp. CAU 1640 TaxID=2933271 RepID=UPI002002A3EE|nr:glycosyltransferase family 4 protein [Subsaxibacter sp. CAU 1640]MCK7590226.1 glycosyltransferase family 4 protein [Subsaxibacter sp. CAU 1640]
MKKLAIVTTHPIQYNAPWFRLLASRNNCDLKVFYTWSQSKDTVKDRTFGREIKWDIPLLDGYDFEFVENVSKRPGSHHFFGIDCPDLISKIEMFNPDAILFFGWNFKSHLLAMRYFKGRTSVWFRGDSTLINESGGLKTKLRRIILKAVYSYIDKAFYVGEANKAYFLKHNLKNGQLVRAPHAIDNERFKDDQLKNYEEKAIEWRRALGYNDDDIVILYAGKFEPVKQLNILIRSVINANKRRSFPVKLLLVGNGPLENDLKNFAIDDPNIQFLGFQNQTQMPIVYRLGDIFCLPSRSETWGLAVNEAMASSRPVIFSDNVGSFEDVYVEGYNGFSFPHSDENNLQKLVEELDLKKILAMRCNSRNHIENFTMLKIVEAIESKIQ